MSMSGCVNDLRYTKDVCDIFSISVPLVEAKTIKWDFQKGGRTCPLVKRGVKSPPAKWLQLIAFGFGRYYILACFQLISGLYPGSSWLMAVAPFVPVWGSTTVMSFVLRKLATCACVLVALAYYTWSASPVRSSTSSSGDDDVAAFYKGKTVRIVVGFPPGGGYDSYSRVIGRHLGKHIPGNPTVIIDNMAGAGSIVAANSYI